MWIDKKEAEAERLAKNPPKSTYQSPEKRAEEMLKIEEQKRLTLAELERLEDRKTGSNSL